MSTINYANPRVAGAVEGRFAVAVVYMPSSHEIWPMWDVGGVGKWENRVIYRRLFWKAARKIKERYPAARVPR